MTEATNIFSVSEETKTFIPAVTSDSAESEYLSACRKNI